MARRPVTDRIPQCPRSEAVDHDHLVETGKRRVVEVAIQGGERLVDPGAAEIQGRRDRPRTLELERADPGALTRPVSGTADPGVPRVVRSSSIGSGGLATGSRSSIATLTRIPPDSSVARLPPFSSAAIRPSQPPLRLRARSPSRQTCSTDSGAAAWTGATDPSGQRASWASARATAASSDGAVTVSRSSARRVALTSSRRVVDELLGLGAGRPHGLVPLSTRATALLVRDPERIGRPQPPRRGHGRGPRWSRPPSPGCGPGSPRTPAGSPSGATGRRRRSPGPAPAVRRSRTPGCRPAARSSAGRSARGSRGRTRPRHCGRRRSCGRRP